MRPESFAYVLPVLSLYAYMVLSSIEFGASIFRMWPKLLRRHDAVGAYLNPVWEATNVFLVYFIICMMTFFPKASGRFGTDLLWVVFPALAFFGLRVIGMLLIYYGDVRSRAADLILFLGSFLSPVTFSLTLVYALTGSWRRFLFAPMTLALALTVVSTIVLVSTAFFRWYGAERTNVRLTRLMFRSFFAAVASFSAFYVLASMELPRLFQTVDRPLWLLCGMTLSCALVTYAADGGKPSYAPAGACLLVATFFLPLASWQLPWLIYPVFTVENAFTDPASFAFMAVASVCGLVLVVPAFILLLKMFVFDKAAKSR